MVSMVTKTIAVVKWLSQKFCQLVICVCTGGNVKCEEISVQIYQGAISSDHTCNSWSFLTIVFWNDSLYIWHLCIRNPLLQNEFESVMQMLIGVTSQQYYSSSSTLHYALTFKFESNFFTFLWYFHQYFYYTRNLTERFIFRNY